MAQLSKPEGKIPPTQEFWATLQEKTIGHSVQPYMYIPKRITEKMLGPKGTRIRWNCGLGSNGKIVFQREEVLPPKPKNKQQKATQNAEPLSPVSEQIQCRRCHTNIQADALFCTQCGRKDPTAPLVPPHHQPPHNQEPGKDESEK